MKKISIKGVVIGSVTDIVATNILFFPVGLYIASTRNFGVIPKEQLSRALMETIQNDPRLFLMQWVIGGGCSMLGGYIAARIAKRNPLLNGALASFLCVSFSLYSLVIGNGAAMSMQHLSSLGVSPFLALCGGYLWLRQERSKRCGEK